MSAGIVIASQIKPEDLRALRIGTITQVMRNAKGSTPTASIIYRPLFAQDVNANATSTLYNARLGTTSFTLTAATWSTGTYSRTLPQNTSAGIYGYYDLSANPLIDGVRLGLGAAQTLAQIDVVPIYANPEATGYFTEPVIWQPSTQVYISYLSDAGFTSSTEPHNFLGYIAEPAGLTLVPPSYTQ